MGTGRLRLALLPVLGRLGSVRVRRPALHPDPETQGPSTQDHRGDPQGEQDETDVGVENADGEVLAVLLTRPEDKDQPTQVQRPEKHHPA